MKYINKKPAPQAFEDWKNANNPTHWSDLQNEPLNPEEGIVYYSKRDLREALLQEQGFLCCYCQQRVANTETTNIEHIFPRNGADKVIGQAKVFDYDNLLAVCDGGSLENRERSTGVRSYPQYCDQHKGENDLPLSPLQTDVEARLIYIQTAPEEVRIAPKAETDQAAVSAIQILNLDTQKLRNLRGQAVSGLIFQNVETGELISVQDAQTILTVLRTEQANSMEGLLTEFYAVKLHFLKLISGE